MRTYEELLNEVRRLPPKQRLRFIEDVQHSMHDEMVQAPPPKNHDDEAAWRKEFEAERAALLKDVPPDSSLHEVLGIARTRKQIPMTKEEDREAILEYLTEKYGR